MPTKPRSMRTKNHLLPSPLLGELHLLPGEIPEEAEAFAAAVRARMRPADVIEEIWVDDFVNLALDVRRLRRLKHQMIDAARPEGLTWVLEPIVGWSRAEHLSECWCAGETDAIREIHAALRPTGMDFEHVTAKAFEKRVAEIEKVDTMLVRAEARRNGALHELALYRDGFAARVREAEAAAEAPLPALAPPAGGGDG